MSLEFSRSLRSLQLDSFRATRVALVLAILNMIVLLIWFLLGQITLYEVSTDLSLNDDGTLVAIFSKESISRIFTGQSAILRIDAGQDQPLVTVPALVIAVEDKTGTAEFLILTDDLPSTISTGEITGQAEIEVEVEYVAPVTLVLRASGKYLGGSQIPVSPQELNTTE